ncbi:hypothetical protein AWZ03_006110 [Drosophila navojoa]|uniref:Uncharacterized protein n=1 Tax=Drosophila navojoa TaxID=7232 RepID=A0A484BFL4_DRONA|nr:hypothetical protein AWZ03_006110 [Drosophila navojoa]
MYNKTWAKVITTLGTDGGGVCAMSYRILAVRGIDLQQEQHQQEQELGSPWKSANSMGHNKLPHASTIQSEQNKLRVRAATAASTHHLAGHSMEIPWPCLAVGLCGQPPTSNSNMLQALAERFGNETLKQPLVRSFQQQQRQPQPQQQQRQPQ